MDDIPNCPKCQSDYTYEDGANYICPECSHEWLIHPEETTVDEEAALIVKDANGNLLEDGDDVSVVRDIKVKGSATSIKVGTKIKGIRLCDPVDGHNIDVRVKGFGSLLLKSELVKKSN
jgi:protein PhnA